MSELGTLSLYIGCMFSGKTSMLLTAVEKRQIARENVLVVKPNIDTRYDGEGFITNHNGKSVRAFPIDINDPRSILGLALETEAQNVAIDEVQFFNGEIVDCILELNSIGIDVFASGLSSDFRAQPFGFVYQLAPHAETIVFLTAICSVCGDEAIYTQRIIKGAPAKALDPIVLIGATDSYEARCKRCFEPPG